MINPLTGQVQPWWYSATQENEGGQNATDTSQAGILGGADSLLISQRAKQLYLYAEEAKGMTGKELKELLEEETTAFKADVEALLKENGFATDPAVKIGLDENGAIKVLGDNEDAEAIEKLLNSDPELAERLNRIKNLDGLQQELASRRAFMRDYARNPYAAVAMYSNTSFDSILNQEQEAFVLSVGQTPE